MDGGEGSWVVMRPVTALLLFGDFLVITALVAWGLTTHYVDPITRPLYLGRTVAPFLVGWLVMAPLAGAFSADALSSLTRMVIAASAGWVGAALVGVALRATPLHPGGADPVFVLVMVGFGLLVVIPWRVAVVVVAGSRW